MNINKAFCLLVGLVSCNGIGANKKEALYMEQKHSVHYSTVTLDQQVLSTGKCVSISLPLEETALVHHHQEQRSLH